jgi:hypothetical protein
MNLLSHFFINTVSLSCLESSFADTDPDPGLYK